MTEETLVALLTQLLKPTLRELPATRGARDRDALAAVLAEAAWSGLALLLRQSLATGEPAALEDIGHFERTASEIRFVPAAALLQAASLRDSPADAHAWMVERAVLYLREGMALLQTVPPEARRLATAPAEPLTPEQKLLQAIFGRAGTEDALADQLTRVARGLNAMARRLSPPVTPTPRPRTARRLHDPAPPEIEVTDVEPPRETTTEGGPTSLTTEP